MREILQSVAASVIAVFAANASAQSAVVSLIHNNGGPVVEIGREVTWSLLVQLQGFESLSADPVLGAINISLTASDPSFGTATDFNFTIAANGGTVGGASTGLSFFNINFTNSLFLEAFGGVLADRTSPMVVGTFTTTASNAASLSYTLGFGTNTGDLVSVGLNPFQSMGLGLADVSFTSDTLIIPAPGAVALFAAAIPFVFFGRRNR